MAPPHVAVVPPKCAAASSTVTESAFRGRRNGCREAGASHPKNDDPPTTVH